MIFDIISETKKMTIKMTMEFFESPECAVAVKRLRNLFKESIETKYDQFYYFTFEPGDQLTHRCTFVNISEIPEAILIATEYGREQDAIDWVIKNNSHIKFFSQPQIAEDDLVKRSVGLRLYIDEVVRLT